MSREPEDNNAPEWDSMIENVMDLIPAKLSNSEWRSLRENINTAIWDYVREIFEQSSIQFLKTRDGKSEIRLWMSVGQDCVDFQKGFDPQTVLSEAYSWEALTLARDMLTARIDAMKQEAAA